MVGSRQATFVLSMHPLPTRRGGRRDKSELTGVAGSREKKGKVWSDWGRETLVARSFSYY